MTKRITCTLAAALMLPYLSVNSVLAKEGKSHVTKSAVTVVGFQADLNSVLPGGNGEGEAEYKSKSSTQGTSESFKAEAEFSIPDASLGITDLNSAQNALFQLHLSHDGVNDYAVCTLAIKEIEFEYRLTSVQIEAEYGVSVSQQTPAGGAPTVSQKVGGCTLLGGTGSAPGVPTVASGDTATIDLVSGTPPAIVSTPVLTGIFQ